ncbi:hypothetical protein ACVXHA_00580 [Escherichia coli]
MEDYTYHFEKGNDLVLGSHMLEVCPSIAVEENRSSTFSISVLVVRTILPDLIFNTQTVPAIVASLIQSRQSLPSAG